MEGWMDGWTGRDGMDGWMDRRTDGGIHAFHNFAKSNLKMHASHFQICSYS